MKRDANLSGADYLGSAGTFACCQGDGFDLSFDPGQAAAFLNSGICINGVRLRSKDTQKIVVGDVVDGSLRLTLDG